MLSHDQIKKLQKIWKKRFGREISEEDADQKGSRLVRIVRLICEPKTTDQDEDDQKGPAKNDQQQ